MGNITNAERLRRMAAGLREKPKIEQNLEAIGFYNPKNPAFEDEALLLRLEDKIRKGASWATAFKSEGLSFNLWWRWRENAGKNKPNLNLLKAIARLEKARGEAALSAEERVFNGAGISSGYVVWLERMERSEWLPEKSQIEVSTPDDKPLDSKDIRKLLGLIHDMSQVPDDE